ncbi:MAG: TetR/AcrR family transcriptional regulator [Desulfobacterales bacterium]|nr:TetR/AcrR family transcriptional regulator [Desulfobacterales bacterium]MCK5203847.1 TetR/AcrR family transcriptional regulator [Desulfobacterales bacterium]
MAGKGTRTRQNIIEKSLQLFCVKGYYNTSINDILEATGLTKGGLYGHFSSKEDIWYAVYDEALGIWRQVVFKGIQSNSSPLERIQTFIENDIKNKLGNGVFEGGCFFHSMLVELSGQSVAMSKHILGGFMQLAGLLCTWLEQADQQGMLKEGLNFKEIANYIIISLNGAAALYASSRDPAILDHTVSQLRFYIRQLKK